MENIPISEDNNKERGEYIAKEDIQNTLLRQIPIEVLHNDSVLNVNQACDSDLEIIGTILDLDESEIQQLLSVEELQSNRTSLIITHEDGSTEETETEVTCLGVTPEAGHRNSLHIQEIVLAANKIQEELDKYSETKGEEEERRSHCLFQEKDHENKGNVSIHNTESAKLLEKENPRKKQEIEDNQTQQLEKVVENEVIKAECNEPIKGKDIEDISEKSEEVKICKSEQIRIIPISLPDGRHIINRSISNDVIEKCKQDQPFDKRRDTSNESQMAVTVNQISEPCIHSKKSDVFHPQDIDACNLSNQVFI